MAQHKTKGSHVIQAQLWIDQRVGAGAFKKRVAGRGADYEGLILPLVWYDLEILVDVLVQVGLEVGMTVQDMTQQIARLNALKDLTTIYRTFLRIAAPVRVMAFTPRLWSTYVSFGEAVAIRNKPGHYVGQCTGVPKKLLDWSCGAWLGFVPTAIELAGGRNVKGTITETRPSGTTVSSDLQTLQCYSLQCEVLYR